MRGGALGGAATLESLDDPAYRGLPDLGYSSRQPFILDPVHILALVLVPFLMCSCRQPPSHYFEQLDTYLHSGRDLDLELEARGSGQLEKKQKGSGSRREEGGLLPPLLALAPQVLLISQSQSQLKAIFSGAAVIASSCTQNGLVPVPWPRPSNCPVPA